MDTLKKFNLEIKNARQMYNTALLTMTTTGQHAVTAVPGKKGAGLPEFQAAVTGGQYAHVALLNVTSVMCVWHRDGITSLPSRAIEEGLRADAAPYPMNHLQKTLLPEAGQAFRAVLEDGNLRPTLELLIRLRQLAADLNINLDGSE